MQQLHTYSPGCPASSLQTAVLSFLFSLGLDVEGSYPAPDQMAPKAQLG
jgi:hypothetical protein